MLCEVSCSKGNVCTTCICHNEAQVADAVFDLSESLKIPYPDRFAILPVIAIFLTAPAGMSMYVNGITLRHLPEEEYEKWQKAF